MYFEQFYKEQFPKLSERLRKKLSFDDLREIHKLYDVCATPTQYMEGQELINKIDRLNNTSWKANIINGTAHFSNGFEIADLLENYREVALLFRDVLLAKKGWHKYEEQQPSDPLDRVLAANEQGFIGFYDGEELADKGCVYWAYQRDLHDTISKDK